MNNQFIRGIKFEWDNISEAVSYTHLPDGC